MYLVVEREKLLWDDCRCHVWISVLYISLFRVSLICTGCSSSIYTPKSPYECVRLELVGVSHSLEPIEELKQTMRDVDRHMLNDPPSGAQRSRWRVNLGKCWPVESSCSHQCHWSSTRSSLLETHGVSEHVYIIMNWSISWHQSHGILTHYPLNHSVL